MAVKVQKIGKVIALQIGQNFENLSVTIRFDMAEWMEEFPEANLFGLFKRPGDEYATPVSVSYDADSMELDWQVGTFETSVTGVGFLEIRAVDPDIGLLKKSKVIPCSIETTLDPGDVIPDPYEDWLSQLLSLASQVEDDAEQAQDAAERADTAADTAESAVARLEEKVSKPVDLPDGVAGQLLRTNGDGTTEWVDQGLPTDEQTAEAVAAWLDDHPEATTTVDFRTAYKAHASVEDMVSDFNLKNGDHVKTLNYYSNNTGGGGFYLIRNKTGSDIIDGGRLIALSDASLVAELIPQKNIIDVMQFGAVCDGVTDDTEPLKKAVYALGIVTNNAVPRILYIPSKIRITDRVNVNRQAFVLQGNHLSGSQIICDGTSAGITYSFAPNTAYELQFNDISFVGNGNNTEPLLVLNNCYNIYLHRVFFRNIASGTYFVNLTNHSGLVWFTECTFDGAPYGGTLCGVYLDGGIGSTISFSKCNIWNLDNFLYSNGRINFLNFYDNWMECVKSCFYVDVSNLSSAKNNIQIFNNVITSHNSENFVLSTFSLFTLKSSAATSLWGSTIQINNNTIYMWDLTGVVNDSLVNIEGGLTAGGTITISFKSNIFTGKTLSQLSAYIYKNNVSAAPNTVKLSDISVFTDSDSAYICDSMALVQASIMSPNSLSQWTPRGINVNLSVPASVNDGRLYYNGGNFYGGFGNTVKQIVTSSGSAISNSTATDVQTLVNDFNSLLTALKASGVIR